MKITMQSYLLMDKQLRTDRGPEGQDDYHYPQQLVEVFLKEYTREGDLVFDPFVGFGTTLVVAESLGRIPLGVEYLLDRVNFTRSRLQQKEAVLHADSRYLNALELPAIDFCMTSPPYMLKDDKENPFTAYTEVGGSYIEYLQDIRSIYAQIAQLLKPGARSVINATNITRDDQLTTLAWDIARSVGEVLTLEQEIILCWQGEKPFNFGYQHEYCLVFRKDK